MEVIPAINEIYFRQVEEKIKIAESFVAPAGGWIHLDVVDGFFAPNVTWGNPRELKEIKTPLNIEVHLMVEKPESKIETWLKAGAKRLIVHVEAFSDPSFILDKAKLYGADVMVAINPNTSIDTMAPYLTNINFFQVLAVDPGIAGQKFQEKVLEKIKFLRERAPAAKIEVDGGINPETAKMVKDAGADMVASASYIFDHPISFAEGYRELQLV